MYRLQQRIREKEGIRKMKYKLDKYELGCLIQCIYGNTYHDEERQRIKDDCLLRLIDIYDNMTTKQKKYIELNDKEHTLAVECLVLTNVYYIRKKQMGMSDEIDNVIHKIHG